MSSKMYIYPEDKITPKKCAANLSEYDCICSSCCFALPLQIGDETGSGRPGAYCRTESGSSPFTSSRVREALVDYM